MIPLIKEAEFIRTFTVRRQPELMLFLGAGASVSSGIPSAREMTWIFKRDIYCTEQCRSMESFKDLSLESIRTPLQDYIQQYHWYPGEGADDEYSVLFEKCWSEERDRRQFIQRYVMQSIPSVGYKSLGALIEAQRVINIITTNFDDLVERCLPANAKTPLFVVSPESKHRLEDTQFGASWLQLFKLHGDFRYDRLQIATKEVQDLDTQMRNRLQDFCREYGLIVVGSSGRDNSVMTMFEEASQNGGFKKGLYWCLKKGSSPSPRVQQLVSVLCESGSLASFVEIESFDELMYHLYQQCGIKNPEVDNIAQERFEHRRPFQFVLGKSANPNIIRTNAIRIKEYPTTLFQFEANIQDWDILRNLVGSNNVVPCLYKNSVLAIGNRSLIQSVFEDYIRGEIRIFDILPRFLQKNRGFVYYIYYRLIEAYLSRQKHLKMLGRRIFYLLPEDNRQLYTFTYDKEQKTIPLASSFSSKWSKGVTCFHHPAFSYKLEYHNDELYFVLQPEIILTRNKYDLLDSTQMKVIANEIRSSMYNQQVSDYLLFWLDFFKGNSGGIEFTYPPGVEPPIARFLLEDDYSLSSMRM